MPGAGAVHHINADADPPANWGRLHERGSNRHAHLLDPPPRPKSSAPQRFHPIIEARHSRQRAEPGPHRHARPYRAARRKEQAGLALTIPLQRLGRGRPGQSSRFPSLRGQRVHHGHRGCRRRRRDANLIAGGSVVGEPTNAVMDCPRCQPSHYRNSDEATAPRCAI